MGSSDDQPTRASPVVIFIIVSQQISIGVAIQYRWLRNRDKFETVN
jgi:hypothetical protein